MPVELTKPTPSTAADKAAALTYMKSNYNWPKSIQFEDKESYNLSFVMNNNSGTIAMNVLKQTGECTSEHCGTAYLNALVMVDMTEAQRTSLVSKAAEAALQEHITTKKKFLNSQIESLKQAPVAKLNLWKGSQTAQGTAQVQQQAMQIKPQVPQDAGDVFTDTSNDEQKFIQRVGVMSNLNVSIQSKKRIGITVYRLFCDKCKSFRNVEAGVVTQRRIEDKVLVEFCNTHRHVAIVPQGEGERKFKDV